MPPKSNSENQNSDQTPEIEWPQNWDEIEMPSAEVLNRISTTIYDPEPINDDYSLDFEDLTKNNSIPEITLAAQPKLKANLTSLLLLSNLNFKNENIGAITQPNLTPINTLAARNQSPLIIYTNPAIEKQKPFRIVDNSAYEDESEDEIEEANIEAIKLLLETKDPAKALNKLEILIGSNQRNLLRLTEILLQENQLGLNVLEAATYLPQILAKTTKIIAEATRKYPELQRQIFAKINKETGNNPLIEVIKFSPNSADEIIKELAKTRDVFQEIVTQKDKNGNYTIFSAILNSKNSAAILQSFIDVSKNIPGLDEMQKSLRNLETKEEMVHKNSKIPELFELQSSQQNPSSKISQTQIQPLQEKPVNREL